MPDQFTDITTKGFGQRILGSIIGIPIGLLLIVVGIGLLYWNEGRYDFSKLAATAIEVAANQQAPADAQGKLIALKGNLTTPEQLGDAYIKPGSYLALTRTSEEFAWVEESHSDSNNNTGGSQTTTTTYTYSTKWIEDVPDSSGFKHPDGHTNPPKQIPSQNFRAGSVVEGNYSLDFATLNLPSFSIVPITPDNMILTPGFVVTSDGKLYKGANSASPQVGDIRISYSALANNFTGTVFGKLNGTSVETFSDSHGHTLYRLFKGGKQDAVATLHNEYRTMLWIFRGVGSLAVFIGLTMLLGPVTTILSFFPTLGRIGSAAVATMAFPVALLISGLTILVGMIARHPIVLAATLTLAVVISALYIRKRGHKLAVPAPQPPIVTPPASSPPVM